VAVAALCLIGSGGAQTTGGKAKEYKGKAPTGWKKLLKLTPEQSAKLREIDRKRHAEEAPLHVKLAEIRAKARQEQLRVLTDAQRKTLRETVEGKQDEAPKDKKKNKE
jgi:Spy/CpxP family protein refolding chaperone